MDVRLSIYGFIKADAVFNDSAGNTLILNAPYEPAPGDNDEFNITANWSRLGFLLGGTPLDGEGKVSGKIEADFYDGSDYELRLRQAPGQRHGERCEETGSVRK